MTRFRLLQQVIFSFFSSVFFNHVLLFIQLDSYVEHLTPAVINDDIFTHICTGFTDQEPAIREATVKVCCGISNYFIYLIRENFFMISFRDITFPFRF